MLRAFLFVLKTVFLAILLLLFQGIASSLIGIPVSSGGEARIVLSLFLVYLAQAGIVGYFVTRSFLRGWKLCVLVFAILFGVTTFLTQIETLVFLRHLVAVVPKEVVPRLFLQGFLAALFFTPCVVAVHGKFKGKEEPLPVVLGLSGRRLVAFVVLSFVYVLVYLGFGSLVFRPLAGRAFEEYYAGLQLPSWILLLQIGRGFVFVLLGFLVVRSLKVQRWEKSLVVALLFSILMGFLLLLPNPYMPEVIRLSHFVEVTLSNFVFGWIVGWWLSA